MLKLGKEKGEVKVVNDHFGKPTYVADLAKQIKWLVECNEYPSGIYHITNSETVSWYDFAVEIFKQAKMDVKVIPCSSDEYITKAKRPAYAVLNNNKLPELRGFKEALADYFDNINSK